MCFQPVERESNRQAAPILPQSREHVCWQLCPLNLERPRSGDLDLHDITLMQVQNFHNRPRQAHGETIAPPRHPRTRNSHWIYSPTAVYRNRPREAARALRRAERLPPIGNNHGCTPPEAVMGIAVQFRSKWQPDGSARAQPLGRRAASKTSSRSTLTSGTSSAPESSVTARKWLASRKPSGGR